MWVCACYQESIPLSYSFHPRLILRVHDDVCVRWGWGWFVSKAIMDVWVSTDFVCVWVGACVCLCVCVCLILAVIVVILCLIVHLGGLISVIMYKFFCF